MNALTIKDNEKFLRQVSQNVVFDDINLPNDIKVLSDFCKEYACFAMASVQLGIPKRMVYVKHTSTETDDNNKEEPFLLINPVILSKKGKTEYWEACVSGLDNFALVERPYEIVVKYFSEQGAPKTQNFIGFTATILSHEIDHLDGIFHMDRAKELLHMNAPERVIWRKEHPYKIISKECNFQYIK